MSALTQSISLQVTLGDNGDAYIHGELQSSWQTNGVYIKHKLFAWHEASFYGTDIAVENVQGTELIVLPAEHVVPFFGELEMLGHIEWQWSDYAQTLLKLTPALAACVKESRHIPSYSAFQGGKLQWTWDEDTLSPDLAELLDRSEDGLKAGLGAAFSAAVFHQKYGSQAAAADLRREFPLLFAKEHAALAGIGERDWLFAIGWKADDAPFRPVLQLLEPDEPEPSGDWPGDDGSWPSAGAFGRDADAFGQDADAFGRDGGAFGRDADNAREAAEPVWLLKLALQDKLEQAAVYTIRLSDTGEPFGSWPVAWTAQVRERASGWLERLKAVLPTELLARGGDVLAEPLSNEAAWRFLTVDSRRLLDAGWQVLLPAWWEAARKKRPRLRAKVAASGSGRSLFGLDALIDFDWRVAIGDAELSEAEFAALVARNERLVRFRGQWIHLDPGLLAQIRRAMASVGNGGRRLSFQDALQFHLLGDGEAGGDEDGRSPEDEERIKLEIELNEQLIQLMGQLGQQAAWPKLEPPEGLRAELRSYQRDGYGWLSFLRQFGLGACLADDMGLGKTVQFIAYLLRIKEQAAAAALRPSLIVCPTSVLGNWQKEIGRFAPSLDVLLHYGSKRLEGESFRKEAARADVVLTSYATAALDQETLQGVNWATICLDEAQNIKNASTKQSSAVRSLPADHRIALTGTPIENRLSELWSIYDFINPGYLGSAKAFNERFVGAVEKERDERRTADLQKLVKPFMLRRKKKDASIQLDLPEKNEMKTYVHLSVEQGALYDSTVNELMERMRTLEGIERKGAILAALTKLKQLCDHPALLTKEPLPENAAELAGGRFDAEALIGRSSKLERLMAMVKELREEGDRCLIFTQYIGMGELLKHVLEHELQEQVLYLNGSTTKTARDRMIERFQAPADESGDSPSPGVFILSLKAGGVGLNLTAASHVFHFDRWWNPAVENQATDRAYRMGQTRDVQVHKFIALGTLEERIDEMLESKLQLSENVISTSEGWITELSTDALRDLFTLRREWVR